MSLNFRPMTSPWKLAKRLALVVFVSCFLCNAVLWTIVYFELFGTRCDFICPQSIGDLIVAIGGWGLLASAFVVPVATIVLTPLILLVHDILKTRIPEAQAFLIAVLTSVVIVLGIGAFLVVGSRGVPVSLKPLVDFSPVVLSALATTFGVALGLLTIEKMLKKRKK